MPRPLAVALTVLFLLGAPLIASPLGDFAPPLALLLVLPPIAVGLSALGWGRWVGERLRRGVAARGRPAALFLLWSAVSALLSLDVAAVAAADVGLEVAGDDPTERDLQLRAAVLGSNLGSLLFPFSNLTNLLLIAATGISFTAYVEAALAPQVVVVVVGAVVLLLAGRRRLAHLVDVVPTSQEVVRTPARAAGAAAPAGEGRATAFGAPAIVAGIAAAAASVGAVATGLAGGPVDVVFALAAAVIVGAALLAGVAEPRPVLRSIPISGVILIVGSALLVEPVRDLARGLPSAPTGTSPADLLVVTLVGGALAAIVNNLPAAAFGAVWLAGADPVTIVAYLVGTDVMCVLTAHGSLATMLVHAVAERRGHPVRRRHYLRHAWRDTLLAVGAALLALILFR
ncbi:MAG: hypothetical protein U0869_10220 [Chloroflexota bacterium]